MHVDTYDRIAQIHSAPPRIVFVFAGAGSLALWQLHRVAGSSRTLLEAVDCYAPRSLAGLLGAPPAQAVSDATARAMASWARRRASALAEGDWPLLGVGLTAALATDRARRGADRCYLAIAASPTVRSFALTLSKERTREEQESLVAQLTIGALALACGLQTNIELALGAGESLGDGGATSGSP